jgi:NAD(P)-dependent dehydrogenase (short-subunit alcohol dehydrogenase family)
MMSSSASAAASHGTKFALEALSDCLRLEVAPFGIDVVVIEPGRDRHRVGRHRRRPRRGDLQQRTVQGAG